MTIYNWDISLFCSTKQLINPASIYLFKVNNGNSKTRCWICSKLTIKTPERRQWRQLTLNNFTYYSSVSIIDFEQANAGWEWNNLIQKNPSNLVIWKHFAHKWVKQNHRRFFQLFNNEILLKINYKTQLNHGDTKFWIFVIP